MMKKNLIYFLLIILVIGIYCYQREDTEKKDIQTIDISNQPIYQSDKMFTRIYDLFGNLDYKITAVTVKQFENTGETLFQSPNITIYNKDHQITWHIQANNAILTRDKLLSLNDNVQINNLLPDAQIEKIISKNVKINLTTQIVTSEDPVTIQGLSFTSTGDGLYGNLQKKTANILKNVKTYYNAATNPSNDTIN